MTGFPPAHDIGYRGKMKDRKEKGGSKTNSPASQVDQGQAALGRAFSSIEAYLEGAGDTESRSKGSRGPCWRRECAGDSMLLTLAEPSHPHLVMTIPKAKDFSLIRIL